jgi:hypothetical protein
MEHSCQIKGACHCDAFYTKSPVNPVDLVNTTLLLLEIFDSSAIMIQYMRKAITTNTHGRADAYELALQIGRQVDTL